MKKIMLLTALALALTITGCKKETKQECDEFAYGTLQFNNNTAHLVKITVDGSYRGEVAANDTFVIEKVAQGTHAFIARSVTATGMVIGEISGSLDVFKCSISPANIN